MNPIEEIRKGEGITRDELAKAAGIGYNTVVSAEKGRTVEVNNKILNLLAELGYDSEEIKKKYQKYRDEERKNFLKREKS